MRGKGDNNLAILALVIIIIAALLYSNPNVNLGSAMSSLQQGLTPTSSQSQQSTNTQTYPPAPVTPPSPSQSISAIFHSAIDPIAPNFLNDRRNDCIAFGGTWYDSADKMGCFGMTPGTFDSTTCLVFPMSQFALQCNSIASAIWLCDSTNAGCYYS